jgi:hypothetical protein
MHCVVQKPFHGNGIDYKSNWLIDTDGWKSRRRNQLISQNYIRVASDEEISSAAEEKKPSSPRRPSTRTRKKKSTASTRR